MLGAAEAIRRRRRTGSQVPAVRLQVRRVGPCWWCRRADEAFGHRVFAYGTAGLAALLLSALYAMRRQIRTAVEVVRESAKVITAIPPLLLYPLVPLVGTLLYVAFWICAAVYIFSVQGRRRARLCKRLPDRV